MATLKNIIKSWFETGKTPTQEQFWAWLDSFWHKDEKIPIDSIDNIEDILNAKADAQALTNHINAKGVADGYAPLNELAKIASEYLTIVDDLTTGGSDSLASAETVKTLKGLIDGINVILGSDNVNLDNVQELVDAIELIQASLPTLQSVLNNGNTAQSLDGGSIVNMSFSLKEFYAQMNTGTSGGQVKATPARSFIRNHNATVDGTIDINAGLIKLMQFVASGGTFVGSTLEFVTPIANATYKIPAKPAGTYTLATTADLGGGATSTLQAILNAGNTAANKDIILTHNSFPDIKSTHGFSQSGLQDKEGTFDISLTVTARAISTEKTDSANPYFLKASQYKEDGIILSNANSATVFNKYEAFFGGFRKTVTNPVTEATVTEETYNLPSKPTGTYTLATTSDTILFTAVPPASATSPGTLGEIRYDANYAYFCVATDTWKRTALTTW